MARLLLKNITKHFAGNIHALRGFSLEMNHRELVAVVGPSGCGKSTLLRVIAGLEEVTSGSIVLNGKVINNVPPKNRNIAMMFQSYVLFPHMTIRENMSFGLALRRVPKRDRQRQVDEVAHTLEIQDLLHRYPHALSGGQRQRAALGRAVLRKPELFLLDEPLSNLDAKMRVQMRTEINRLHKSLGTNMIFVTHDQTEAMTMGDRIVVLKDGCIQQADKPMTVYQQPANRFVAGFIGSPSMNFLRGELKGTGEAPVFRNQWVELPLNKGAWESAKSLRGKEVELGFRPEDVSLGAASPGDGPPAPGTLSGVVDMVEYMGPYLCVYVALGDFTLVATCTGEQSFFPEQTLVCTINTKKIHLFDCRTGMRLGPGGN